MFIHISIPQTKLSAVTSAYDYPKLGSALLSTGIAANCMLTAICS